MWLYCAEVERPSLLLGRHESGEDATTGNGQFGAHEKHARGRANGQGSSPGAERLLIGVVIPRLVVIQGVD